MTCVFCSIYEKNKENIIYETPLTFCILDRYPISKGHLLVIPKKHRPSLHEYEDEELKDILQIIGFLCRKLGLVKYNVLQNNGNYQSVFHVHFHVIPCVNEVNKLSIQWNTFEISDKEYLQEIKYCTKSINN